MLFMYMWGSGPKYTIVYLTFLAYYIIMCTLYFARYTKGSESQLYMYIRTTSILDSISPVKCEDQELMLEQ